jgi:hypothetical protein
MNFEKLFLNKILFYTLLLSLILTLTFFDTINRDYTSVIDFDLTVIHNALQIISNTYPDYRDHTAYSQFFLYGIFYKLFSFFDKNLITNIYLLAENKNPEVTLQKLYLISRYINSTIIFLLIVFFNKILNIFKIKNNLVILSTFFLLTSKSVLLNFFILRADIIAVCFFFISFYYLISFAKYFQIINLFIFSFFMIFSLLAKVQIIFAFYFLILFFIFYQFYENKNINNFNLYNSNLLFKKLLKINFKFIIIIPIIFYFIFQYIINNFINSNEKIGYLDSFIFGFFFLIIYLILFFICKKNLILKNYFYSIFSLIILFSFFPIFLLKTFNLLNFIQVDFNILFSTINPFYFLKSYSTFSGQQFSLDELFKMLIVLFSGFQFNLIYSLFLIFIYFISLFRFGRLIFNNNLLINTNYTFVYIFLFCSFCLFLISVNNFRYNPLYDIYIYPFFLLALILFIHKIGNNFRNIFILIFISCFVFNFYQQSKQIKSLFEISSNHQLICQTKSLRDFYFVWAKSFDESFFKKLCLNKQLLFK